ncbi:MAG: hypothetical protein OEL76_11635 [Siculibacillus sp.]|nr:hypothetical protein [Siculibacillus sp.]
MGETSAREGEGDAGLPVCNALWIGERLGPIARACLASFLRRGHRVRVHSYRALDDLPEGAEAVDAASVVPRRSIVRHRRSGSPALFSDLFRYELLRRGAGIWIDADLYCVRPIDFPGPNVFGFEEPGSINGAVLGLAPDDPILDGLLSVFADPGVIPPWVDLPGHHRILLKVRHLLGLGDQLADLPWGAVGPRALTWLLREDGRLDEAQPIDAFYPLHWSQIDRLYAADGDIEAVVTPRTRTIHLWNNLLARRPLEAAETGSFLERLVAGTLTW